MSGGMRFGLAQPPLPSVADTVAIVEQAERVGLDTAWVADQTFHADPYVILAAAALRTQRIELALGLTNPSTRHPAITARAAASVAALAAGRFVLGVGVGNTRELLGPLGLLTDRPAVAIREAVTIIRGLLAGGPVRFEGDLFRCTDVALEMDQPPPVPLVIGGRGERILRLAGRVGDGVMLSVAGLDSGWDLVSESATRAGRSSATVRRVAWGECIIDPTDEEIERQRRILAHVLGRAPVAGLLALGHDPELVDTLKAAYETDGIEGAARHVSTDLLARHAVIGTLDECLDRLRRMEQSGIDDFVALIKLPSYDERREYVDTFAQRVVAALR